MDALKFEEIEALIQKRPRDPEPYQMLGRKQMDAGDMAAARLAFKQSLALSPDDPWTRLYVGNWLSRSGKPRAALKHYRRAAERMPDEAIVYSCLADTYRILGEDDLAEANDRAAALMDPAVGAERGTVVRRERFFDDDGKPTREMVRDALKNERAATALLLAERHLPSDPDDVEILRLYATMLYKTTRYDEAEKVFLDLIDHVGDDKVCWIYICLGRMEAQRGRFDYAECWYQQAVDAAPLEAAGHIYLGGIQIRQGRLAEAEATYRAATLCDSGCIDEAHHNLGLALRVQGRLAEAADSFRRAIELDTRYAAAIEALEDVKTAMELSAIDDPAPLLVLAPAD